MPDLFLFVFRFFRLLLSGNQAVALENAALRLQLAAFRRSRKRPVVSGKSIRLIRRQIEAPAVLAAIMLLPL